MSDFKKTNYICHYGVKGQKWGVRNEDNVMPQKQRRQPWDEKPGLSKDAPDVLTNTKVKNCVKNGKNKTGDVLKKIGKVSAKAAGITALAFSTAAAGWVAYVTYHFLKDD